MHPKSQTLLEVHFYAAWEKFKLSWLLAYSKLPRRTFYYRKQRKNDKYRSYKGEVGKVADNLLNREFTANKPFEKLTTDVTQFKGKKPALEPENIKGTFGQFLLTHKTKEFLSNQKE